MKKGFKFLVTNLLVLALVFSSLCFANVNAKAEDMTGQLVVLHTNDIHGKFEKAVDETTGAVTALGIASVAEAKKYYESLGANVLLLDAGDFSQGELLVNHYDGMTAIEFMNAAGYDAVSLGNHEFDHGFDALMAMVDEAKFPVLDANILSDETDEPYFEACKIFEFDNMKVGVFGLDTAETQTKSSPVAVAGMNFLDGEEMFDVAKAEVKELQKAGCDYIIALGHLGTDDESLGRRSIDVMENVKGIDLFVDGHSHSEFPEGLKAGKGIIASTGTKLANLGVVTYDGKKTVAKLVPAAEYDGGMAKKLNKKVNDYVAEVNEIYAGTFATSLVDLDGNRDPGVRTMETNLGDFSSSAYLYAAQKYADENDLGIKVAGAIQNGGGIRASITAGEISMATLYTVFPFGNTIAIVEVTGEQLLEALEASCAFVPTAVGGFPQVTGIKFSVDATVPYENGELYEASTYYEPANPGSRVTIKKVGGKKFDMDKTYYIAVNNFMAEGGDTYAVFQNCNVIYTGVVDADALIDYVNSMDGVIGEEFAKAAGNIKIKAPEVSLYTVVSGDFLKKIAKNLLGDENRWQEIFEANKAIISNPDQIQIGQVLTIPE